MSLLSFNEFNDKDNSVLFNFRESEKERKGNSKISFSSSNPLSPKKYKKYIRDEFSILLTSQTKQALDLFV